LEAAVGKEPQFCFAGIAMRSIGASSRFFCLFLDGKTVEIMDDPERSQNCCAAVYRNGGARFLH